MKIKLIRSISGHNIGDEITVTAGASTLLIEGGYAEATSSTQKKSGKTSPATPKRSNESDLGGDSSADPS